MNEPQEPAVSPVPAITTAKSKRPFFAIGGVAVIVILVLVTIFASKQNDGEKREGRDDRGGRDSVATLDTANLPTFIQADFIDLGPITSISKFRSLAGHDFSNAGETCRSMKHYYNQNIDPNYKPATFEGHSIPAPPDGVSDLAIYSPVDGTISQIVEEHMPIGKQFYIVPSSQPNYTIRIFHVFPSDGIAAGQKVKAGQQIGVIAKGQGTDISVEYGLGSSHDQFVSYFDVMPDSLFAKYAAKGLTNREDVIISKSDRDAKSVTCTQGGDQAFHLPAGYDEKNDYVYLSGYVAPARGGQQ